MIAGRRGPTVLIAASTVVALAIVSYFVARGKNDDRSLAAAPGAALSANSLEGGALAVPGQLTGVGAVRLKVAKGRDYTIESWRFRHVWPHGTDISYRLRPEDAYGETNCRGGHRGFDGDAVRARRDGDEYPCRMEGPRMQHVTPQRGWEMIAVFWAAVRPGTVMRVADPEAIVRDRDGRRFRVDSEPFSQSICVMGGRPCARWLARSGGFRAAEAEKSIAMICALSRRPPLFAAPADRPQAPMDVPRGTDASGRACWRSER